MVLHLDIETYSSLNLRQHGVYAYAESPDFRLLLLAYAFDDGPVELVQPELGDKIPGRVLVALASLAVTKMAHNAQFERVCLSVWIRSRPEYAEIREDLPMLDLGPGEYLDPRGWFCTMIHAASCGYPLDLDTASRVALENEKLHKDSRGKALIRKFCGPVTPTERNGWRDRNRPADFPLDWKEFGEYCRQDVVAERALGVVMDAFPLHSGEGPLWVLDQTINDRGVRVDPPLVYAAIKADEAYKKRMIEEALQLVPSVDNPKSVKQMKDWILESTGEVVESLNKKTVPALLKTCNCEITRRMLEIRQELSKTSVSKYQAMARNLGHADRVRGLLQFNGAGRTGRWAGRLVQVQNLPQNHLPDLERARALVRDGDVETVEMLYPSLPAVLSELIRTAFIPQDGCKFVVADFSAIEARVISWLAGEDWRLEVFRTHGKIYEASAAQMFKVPIESITKTSPMRQRGKVAELALGYQGGENAMIAMGALDNGLAREELKPLVSKWRAANKKIVKLWAKAEDAVMTVLDGEPKATICGRVRVYMKKRTLLLELPSGRRLCYVNARLEPHQKFSGQWSIVYDGVGQERKSWGRVDSYGGKLTENIVQAIARDLLADSMLRLAAAGFRIVMHVHDEVVLEVPRSDATALQRACAIMGQAPAWADGLPLRADGYECEFYKKD